MKDFFVFRRHPHLKERLPIVCVCGVELEPQREYVNERFCGVETDQCACGAGPARLYTYVDKEAQARAAARLEAIAGRLR